MPAKARFHIDEHQDIRPLDSLPYREVSMNVSNMIHSFRQFLPNIVLNERLHAIHSRHLGNFAFALTHAGRGKNARKKASCYSILLILLRLIVYQVNNKRHNHALGYLKTSVRSLSATAPFSKVRFLSFSHSPYFVLPLRLRRADERTIVAVRQSLPDRCRRGNRDFDDKRMQQRSWRRLGGKALLRRLLQHSPSCLRPVSYAKYLSLPLVHFQAEQLPAYSVPVFESRRRFAI